MRRRRAKLKATPTNRTRPAQIALDAFNRPPNPMTPREKRTPTQRHRRQAEGERYHALIASAVKRYYDVSNPFPAKAERIRLHADVRLKLDGRRRLIGRRREELGQRRVRQSVLLAVKKAAPFGPPPPHLRSTLQKDGVTLRLRRDCPAMITSTAVSLVAGAGGRSSDLRRELSPAALALTAPLSQDDGAKKVAAELDETLKFDLAACGLFQVLDPEKFL